jgi:nucleotide-binding universal stress UspA family protein
MPDFPGAAIVSGVDGSDTALAAAETAAEVADRLRVRLVLAHVEAEDDGRERTLDAVLEAVRARAPRARVEEERRQGQIAEELINIAREHGAGLLAVGSRGRGAVKSGVPRFRLAAAYQHGRATGHRRVAACA